MTGFCRECFAAVGDTPRCESCGSPRLLRHPELDSLSIAHVDCDAFYAAVEKRDDPSLRDKAVIVGSGHRGVVTTACYIARLSGVHSAMPMFKALAMCKDAVVIKPNMAKYAAVSRELRHLMLSTTPLVEPLSLDEAFLDLSGTERVHRQPPAQTLAHLAARVERDIGISISVGLSYNKSLAKLASDLEKPRGFAVIGRAEALDFLKPRRVGDIWGVGKAMQARLAADNITLIGQLQRREEIDLMARYGAMGKRLYHFARGEDDRPVSPDHETKSISAETTFNTDLSGGAELGKILWPLCERVSARLKRQDLAGRTVTVKLKTARFKSRTRAVTLPDPTQLAETLFQAATPLLAAECDGTAFRLLGVGVSHLDIAARADPPSLLDPGSGRRAEVERVIDSVRARFGDQAIGKGRGLNAKAASSRNLAKAPATAERPSGRSPRSPEPDRR